MKTLRVITRTIDKITGFFGSIAQWSTLLLVLLTVEQVIARYVFNSSSIGLQELEWHLFGVIFLLAAANAQRSDVHVRVDIFYGRFSPRAKAWVNVLGVCLAMMPMCALIAWYGIEFTKQALAFDNSRPIDYYTSGLAGEGTLLYNVLAPLEVFLRKFILIGEISPDPGGLEARWLIRAAIPTAAILLLLQAVAMAIRNICVIAKVDLEPGPEES